MPITQSRRHFLTTLSLAGASSLMRASSAPAAEGSLETTTVRISNDLAICEAPLEIAGELLRAEGFTDVGYVDTAADDLSAAIADRKVDFALDFPVLFAPGIDAGKPITVLAGVHVGCFELFAGNDIRTIANLKGRTVGCEIAPSAFLRLMLAQVGLDPDKDIRWVTDPSVKPLELFAEGKIDAFLGFPPEPQELRARTAGHVIFSTVLDRPWSQYFCCMVLGNRDYVRKYPVATKRVLRAILKATDLCATEPARVARSLVDGGFTPRYDYALQTLNDVPYNNWREIQPRGHDPLLRAAPTRRRPRQVDPAEDHRRRHGLALPQRAQTRAEGVNANSYSPCPGRAHGCPVERNGLFVARSIQLEIPQREQRLCRGLLRRCLDARVEPLVEPGNDGFRRGDFRC